MSRGKYEHRFHCLLDSTDRFNLFKSSSINLNHSPLRQQEHCVVRTMSITHIRSGASIQDEQMSVGHPGVRIPQLTVCRTIITTQPIRRNRQHCPDYPVGRPMQFFLSLTVNDRYCHIGGQPSKREIKVLGRSFYFQRELVGKPVEIGQIEARLFQPIILPDFSSH